MVAHGRARGPAARRLSSRRMRVPLRVIVASGVVLGAAVPAVAVPTATAPGYAPCSVITWRYDGSAQPASGAGMLGDVRGALALVSVRAGVSFAEAPAGAVADLVLDWSPLADHEPGTQAAAWRSGVSFGIDAEMARDVWSGFGRKAVRRGGGSFDVGVGRGWMVVHEVLHSLGLGHSDEEGSVMSPVARITNVLGRTAARREQRALPRPGFTPGDLATLEAMYPRAGCPGAGAGGAGNPR